MTARIALLGGTGDIGEGLALRWAFHSEHEVVVGSRDADRARSTAAEYEAELAERGVERSVEGAANAAAAEDADVVVLSIPPRYVTDTIEAVGDALEGSIVVTPAVGMTRDDDGFHYDPPSTGSMTELVAATVPEGVPVVGTFHNLPAAPLADLDEGIDFDALVVGDDAGAKATVRELVAPIDGLDTVDAGGLANAAEVEGITPLLINVGMNNDGLRHAGIRFTK